MSSCFLWGMRPESPDPVIRVNRLQHDFGNIPGGEPVSTEFTVTNRGGKPLNLARVATTCGCTAAVLGNQLLNPGESTKLKVSYDPRGKTGQQSRTVTIFSNDPRTPQIGVNISANIVPEPIAGNIRPTPGFPQVTGTTEPDVSKTEVGIRAGQASGSSGTLASAGISATDVAVNTSKVDNTGAGPLLSSHPEAKFKPESPDPVLWISATQHDFGNIPDTEPVTYSLTIQNRGGRTLVISRVATTCGCATGVPGKKSLKSGESTELKLTLDPRDKNGPVARTLSIFSNAPANLQQLVHILATVNSANKVGGPAK